MKENTGFWKYMEMNFNTYITILIMIMMLFSLIVSIVLPSLHRP